MPITAQGRTCYSRRPLFRSHHKRSPVSSCHGTPHHAGACHTNHLVISSRQRLVYDDDLVRRRVSMADVGLSSEHWCTPTATNTQHEGLSPRQANACQPLRPPKRKCCCAIGKSVWKIPVTSLLCWRIASHSQVAKSVRVAAESGQPPR